MEIANQFRFYWQTLEYCGVHLLSLTDIEIGSYIFEEFEINVFAYLGTMSLRELEYAKLIDEEIRVLSGVLKMKYANLRRGSLANVEAIKSSKEWHDILELSDFIKEKIRFRLENGYLELKYSVGEVIEYNMTTGKLFFFYYSILCECCSNLFELSDALLEYYVFIDILDGMNNFFDINSLNHLMYQGVINVDIRDQSVLLRRKYLKLRDRNLFTLESVRTSESWNEVFVLSEKIKAMIHITMDNDEIEWWFQLEDAFNGKD